MRLTGQRARFPARLSAFLVCALVALPAACGGHGSDQAREGASARATPAPMVFDVTTIPGRLARPTRLPTGDPPTVPWTSGAVLHTPEQTVMAFPLRKQLSSVGRIVPLGSGFVLGRYYPNTGTKVQFFDSEGRLMRSVPGEGPVVSADGERVAWWEYPTREVVISSTAGEVLQRIAAPRSWDAKALEPRQSLQVGVVGWVGRDELLLTRYDYGKDEVVHRSYWRTSGAPVPAWSFWNEAAATVPMKAANDTLVLGRVTYDSREPDCLAAYRIDSADVQWRHCYRRPGEAFGPVVGRASPDGKYVLLSGLSQTSGSRGFTVVLDSRTGRPVARFDAGRYLDDRTGALYGVWGYGDVDAAFEADDHVLLAVYELHRPLYRPHPGNYTGAIMRCDLELNCENASPPASWTQWWQDAPQTRAYALP